MRSERYPDSLKAKKRALQNPVFSAELDKASKLPETPSYPHNPKNHIQNLLKGTRLLFKVSSIF